MLYLTVWKIVKELFALCFSIILNYIFYIIKLGLGPVYARKHQQFHTFVSKPPCCTTFYSDSVIIMYNNLHMQSVLNVNG